ncbi:transposase [Rhizobium sullae]|uniref:transposase n=1 Tax=Rhizobium sullae TaxID=50338 RepID=UPI001FE14975|nr:transposase [Rhizobium sullae]
MSVCCAGHRDGRSHRQMLQTLSCDRVLRLSQAHRRSCSGGPDVYQVMDNYATHKTPKIKSWLARRPHWHVHFTPTSASWINQVERWFAELARKELQRGVQRSAAEL